MAVSRRARLRRLLRPPRRLRITGAGRVYLLVTVGVGLGALNTGNNLLYLVLGLLLSLIVVSGVLSERCLRGLQVRRLLPEGCHAAEPFPLRYALRRPAGWSFALAVEEDGGALQGRAWAPAVGGDDELVVRADPVAPRRGPLRLAGVKVTTTFPFGLFAKSMVVDQDGLLLVYPRRGFTCEVPPTREGPRSGDGGNPHRRDGTADLHSLRELLPLEPARGVHWVKSAQWGKLLKVEREREERVRYLLQVRTDLPQEVLDRECEEAAALSERLLGLGHEVGLSMPRHQLRPGSGPGQRRRVLSALAWAGHEEESP